MPGFRIAPTTDPRARRARTLAGFILLLAAALSAQGCRDGGESPEEQIRRFIDAGVQAAEDRSADALTELVHDNYIDQQGRNRKQLGLLSRAYFMRHQNIHLFTRIDSIEFLAENQASVSLLVAMAGTVISDVDALASLSARVYRFELQLIKEDDWRLRHASWGPANLSAFD
jgi:hypothetical protein